MISLLTGSISWDTSSHALIAEKAPTFEWSLPSTSNFNPMHGEFSLIMISMTKWQVKLNTTLGLIHLISI